MHSCRAVAGAAIPPAQGRSKARYGRFVDWQYEANRTLDRIVLPPGEGTIDATIDPSTGAISDLDGPDGVNLAFDRNGPVMKEVLRSYGKLRLMVATAETGRSSDAKRSRLLVFLFVVALLAIGGGLFALYWAAHLWGLLMVICEDAPSSPRCLQPTWWAWGGIAALTTGGGCLAFIVLTTTLRHVRSRRRKREADRKWVEEFLGTSTKDPDEP